MHPWEDKTSRDDNGGEWVRGGGELLIIVAICTGMLVLLHVAYVYVLYRV